jgi:hypothetical protein
MKKMFILMVSALVLFSCKKDKDKEAVFKGPEVQVHNGKAWTWLKVTEEGTPAQLGISMTNALLNTVPVGDEGDHGHSMENIFALTLPAEALQNTPFKYVGFDWNPSGHEPDGIYNVPHFDFHFYMLTQPEIAAAVDMATITVPPAAGIVPQGYVAGAPVPQMGWHWVDPTSAEFDPALPKPSFTQTFIFGTYNGKVNFYEPMITLAFLKNTSNFERSIPQPAKVSTTGYYPSKLRVVKEGNETAVILDGFVLRQAS